MTPIERHLADFLLAHQAKVFRAYVLRCLEVWEREYGDVITAKAKALAKKEWAK